MLVHQKSQFLLTESPLFWGASKPTVVINSLIKPTTYHVPLTFQVTEGLDGQIHPYPFGACIVNIRSLSLSLPV